MSNNKALQYFLSELKSAAQIKLDAVKMEAIAWQRLTSAIGQLERNMSKGEKEKVRPVNIVQEGTAPRYMDAKQAAKYLGISRSKLYTLRGDGTLRCVKVGGRPRYKLEDLEAVVVDA